jgi:hypothetical protein
MDLPCSRFSNGVPIKKIRPRIAPRPDLYGARFTSDRAAILIHIATTEADVKRRWIINAGRPRIGARHGACQIEGHQPAWLGHGSNASLKDSNENTGRKSE